MNRLVAVVNRDGKLTARPAPWTITDRIRAAHDELWALEPGPVYAARRDELRRLEFALRRSRRRSLRLVPDA